MTEPDARQHGPGGTPEGHTAEAPAADEFGKKGTPAAALTPAVPHAADADTDADTDADSAHAGDEHEAGSLGPIDWPAWGMSALGLAIALGICLFLTLPSLGR